VAISLLTIFVIAFITYYAFNEGLPLPQFTMHALVDNSVAVRSNSPVRIAGVDVGKVTDVTPAGRATEINFTVEDNGRPIHTDATVRVQSRLFLEGGYYLNLSPGSPSAPVAGDGYMIPESQTATPVQFYQVLSTFDRSARLSLENTLNTLNDGFSSVDHNGNPVAHPGSVGLKNTIAQLAPTLKDIAWVTRGLRGTRPGDVETLLASGSQVMQTLSDHSTQLQDLVTGLNRTSSALAASDGALAQSVSGLDQTLQVAPAALTAIDQSLPPVAKLGQVLDPSLKVAPPIVAGLTSVVKQLAAVVKPAERTRLLTSLNATFSQFPSLLGQLGSLFPVTKSVTDCLNSHVTPTLNTIVPDGKLTSGRPVWQDFVHFLPHVASSSQNFDANGYWLRLLVGAGTNTLSLGSLPIVGNLVGSASPGGGAIQGSSPVWVGDLTSSAFRPDVECSSQALPNFASAHAAPDLHAAGATAAAPAVGRSQLLKDVAKRVKAINARAGR
jgi:virulence factor Mce-like protein